MLAAVQSRDDFGLIWGLNLYVFDLSCSRGSGLSRAEEQSSNLILWCKYQPGPEIQDDKSHLSGQPDLAGAAGTLAKVTDVEDCDNQGLLIHKTNTVRYLRGLSFYCYISAFVKLVFSTVRRRD